MRTGIPTLLKAGIALIAFGTSLAAQQISGSCSREDGTVVCDVRHERGRPISDITAVAEERPKPSSVAFSARNAPPVAYYFLIQLTPAVAADSVHIIGQLTKENNDNRVFGVGTFAERLEDRSISGGPLRDVAALKEQILKDVREGNNAHVDLYRSALEAVRKLNELAPASKNSRKVLVIFSDGRTKYRDDRDKFIKAAGESGVFVHVISIVKRDATGSDPGALEKLAADVNGVALSAGCGGNKRCDLDDAKLREFLGYHEQGVRVRFPATAVSGASELTFSAKLDDGSSVQSQPIPIKFEESASASWRDAAIAWVLENRVAGASAGAVVASMLLLGLYLVLRRRKIPPTRVQGQVVDAKSNSDGGTLVCAADPNPEHVYAWLQFLGGEAPRVPLGSPNIRIGRHGDNDIILQHKTVHRKHAILLMRPNQRFSINDLGGENGIVVNGERVSERDLNDADLIELGEVRMRFYTNNC